MGQFVSIGVVLVGLILMLKQSTSQIKEILPSLEPRKETLYDIDWLAYEATPTALGYDYLYQQYAKGKSYDWKLLKAIAQVESDENPNATNPVDPSYGLCQILCQPDGVGGCRNALNVAGWPPSGKDALYDPDYNVYIASQILEWNIANYGLQKGIAVYNSWSANTADRSGPFPNQSYVEKVNLKYYALI